MTNEEYIDNLDEELKKIAEYLHELMMSFPGVKTKIRYGIPFYDINHWIVYISPFKTGGIEFAFVRGSELNDDNNILEARGRKMVKSIIINSMKDIKEKELNELILEAIILDKEVPYSLKKKSK